MVHPDAVRTKDAYGYRPSNPQQVLLQIPTLLVSPFTEPSSIEGDGLHALGSTVLKELDRQTSWHAGNHKVNSLWDICDTGIDWQAHDLSALGTERIDLALVPRV
jgi:hypothetical protein